MQPKPEFLNPDDFPEPHMEAAARVSEADAALPQLDLVGRLRDSVAWLERDGFSTSAGLAREAAAELRRLAAVKRDRDELVSRFHCLMADFGLHPGRTDDDLLVILRQEIEAWRYGLHHLRDNNVALRADRDRLAAEVEALRADAALGRFVRTRVTECHNGWAIAQTFIHGAPSLEDVADAVPAIDAAKAKESSNG